MAPPTYRRHALGASPTHDRPRAPALGRARNDAVMRRHYQRLADARVLLASEMEPTEEPPEEEEPDGDD
jgi:hypothetical protein